MIRAYTCLRQITNYCLKNNYMIKDPFLVFKLTFKKTTPIYINKQELYMPEI